MSRGVTLRRAVLCLGVLCLLAIVAPPSSAAVEEEQVATEEAAPGPEPRAADREALEQAFASGGAAREARTPGWGGYPRELWTRFARRLLKGFLELLAGTERALERLGLPPGVWLRWGAGVLLVLAGTLLAIWLVRRLRARRRDGEGEVVEGPRVEAATGAQARDAAAWWADLQRWLAAGRVPEALESLWWWLARSLAGQGADPTWTGRELLRATGRGDLSPAVRRLEAMAYGRRRPAAREVGELAVELSGAVS